MAGGYLHPEWANLRFLGGTEAQSLIGPGEPQPCPAFTVTGPTIRAARFRPQSGRRWGAGCLPAGWAALFAAQAGDYADRIVDGLVDPAFAAFAPLAHALAASDGDHAAELALTEALLDPELVSVAQLAEQMGMNVRALERLSRRAFGFPPKLLLRRQRFLRSLARFMIDPSLGWLGALDCHYHDQSHFVRDFRRFMGMNTSAYAKADKPILVAAARGRMAIAGEAARGLHRAPYAAAAV